MFIGYARVSTTDQTLALQQDALQQAGCSKIFTDTASGALAERKGLADALSYVRPGDTLVVWKLDRLGRSLKDLIARITELQNRQIGFKSLTEQIDTTTSGGKLIFHIFGSLADDAECAVMRSDPTGTQECPGLRRRSASHNLRPQRGICVRAALPSWPVAVWTEAISDAPIDVTFRSSTSASLG